MQVSLAYGSLGSRLQLKLTLEDEQLLTLGGTESFNLRRSGAPPPPQGY